MWRVAAYILNKQSRTAEKGWSSSLGVGRPFKKLPCYKLSKLPRTWTGFWWGNLRERDHMEDPVTDGRIILKWIFRKQDGGMDWIDLARNSERWWALVNAVMNLRITMREIS